MEFFDARLSDMEALKYMAKLRRARQVPPGVDPCRWYSHVAHRPPRWRRRMLKEHDPNTLVICMHVAAMAIQRHVRGFVLRIGVGRAAPSSNPNRVPMACRRATSVLSAWRASRPPRDPAAGGARGAQSTELSLVARFLESKVRLGPSAGDIEFNDWILLRLQAWARMVPWRAYRRSMRSYVLHEAARSLQHGRKRILRRRAGLEPAAPRDAPFSRGRAAFVLQRAWRGFTNRRIFGYLREMLRFRQVPLLYPQPQP